MQVYLAVHSSRHLIVVQKRILNAWWHGAQSLHPSVVNQANQFALPGGRFDHTAEETIAGALREFAEECGVTLSAIAASSLSVGFANAQYAMVQYEVSDTILNQILNQITLNTAPSPLNPAQPAGMGVQDWEWSNPQLVQLSQAANFLGNLQAIPLANQVAVAARPAHSQSITWYAAMAAILVNF